MRLFTKRIGWLLSYKELVVSRDAAVYRGRYTGPSRPALLVTHERDMFAALGFVYKAPHERVWASHEQSVGNILSE